jgi:hypothetical protein
MRSLLRKAVPEKIRMLAHPYPSLREALLYPQKWGPSPSGDVLVLSSRIGSAIAACGGTLTQWSLERVPIHLAWSLNQENEGLLDVGQEAASILGVKSTHLLSDSELESFSKEIRPTLILAPGLFSGLTRVSHAESAATNSGEPRPIGGSFSAESLVACARAARPKTVAFHDGDGPVAVNAMNELGEECRLRRRRALDEISLDLAPAADGLSEYRGFTAGFFRGYAEAFLRMRPTELRRLLPFLL